MTEAHRPNRDDEVADCGFTVQSENEAEVVALATNNPHVVHGRDDLNHERRQDHLAVVSQHPG